MLVVVIVTADVGRDDSGGGRRTNIDQTNRRKLSRGGEVFKICEVFKIWKPPGTNLCHSANVEWVVFSYESGRHA